MKTIIALCALMIAFSLKAQVKTPSIILYEDGTWEKVDKESTKDNSKKITIEETWDAFKLALKAGNKEKVADFFEFPVSNEISNSLTNSNLVALNGSMTKKKLLEKFEILFDKELISLILNKDSEEYQQSQTYTEIRFYTLKREMEYNTGYEIKKVLGKYVLGFKIIGNKFKICMMDVNLGN